MDIFKKINESEVMNAQGYSVKFSHNKLTYRESIKSISVDIEHNAEPYKMIIYANTLNNWYPPFSTERISNDKKLQILERMKSALTFLGINYDIEA